MKRIATIAIYAIGTLAVLYIALYAYAMLRQRSLTPGEPIHIFRNPDAPDYSQAVSTGKAAYCAVCFRNSATSRAVICERLLPKRAVT
jgi:hypothetical protein